MNDRPGAMSDRSQRGAISVRWTAGLVAAVLLSLHIPASTAWADEQPVVEPLSAPAGEQPEDDDDGVEWSARLRWGLEYDDNPHRLEEYDGSGDALSRYLIGFDMSSDIGSRARMTTRALHGGTWYRRQRDANAALTEVRGAVTGWAARWVYAQVLADVKDRTEADSRRDYSRGGAAVRAGSSVGPLRLWVDGGWRFFAFKPSESSSHRGPRIRGGLRWMIRSDLAADLSVARSWRSYRATAWVRDDDQIVTSPGVHRSDDYDVLRLAATYQRRFSARLRYQHLRNRSNSYGQGLRRHSVEASATVPLPWELFVSARAELQRTHYEDPVFVDDEFQLDEENRNTFIAAIARPVYGPWTVELRYSLYAQEFGVFDDEYRRQTIALSIGIELDD